MYNLSKDPQNIDDAVEYVVNYKDTYRSRWTDGKIRATKTTTDMRDSGDEESFVKDEREVRAACDGNSKKRQKTDSTKSALSDGKDQSHGNQRDRQAGYVRAAKQDQQCFTCGGVGHFK